MANEDVYLHTINAGEISPLAAGRVDLAKMKLAAKSMVNILPRAIGPVRLRPGSQMLGETKSDGAGKFIPFVFSATDTAFLEFTDLILRIWDSDALLVRPTLTTTQITSSTFAASTGWSTSSTGGSSSITGGFLVMDFDSLGGQAKCTQTKAILTADRSKDIGLRVTIERGPVILRVGDNSSDDNLINEVLLPTGVHSLVCNPGGASSIFIQLSTNQGPRDVHVDACELELGGTLELPIPWALDDLASIRYDQSADVIYVTHPDFHPYRIERRNEGLSWSVSKVEPVDGPFKVGPEADLTLTPSVRNGNGTLTASKEFFKDEHVGCLFRLWHTSQSVSQAIIGNDQFADPIIVRGTGATIRSITRASTGTWVGNLRSQEANDPFENFWAVETNTANVASGLYAVTQDNVDRAFRMGFGGSDRTSGTPTVTYSTQQASGFPGILRITAVSSSTSASYETMTRMWDITATKDWEQGEWSDIDGWPKSVALFEGRLWYGGFDKVWGSVSDDFNSFDPETEGDSGPILRSVANGPVNNILGMLGLNRLCMFTSGAEPVGRSTSFDEPLTPTNFSVKDASTQGSADVQPVKIDKMGIFIQRSGRRAYEISYSGEASDYVSEELTRFHPTILEPEVVEMAVQRQPDTRIYFVLSDGTVSILTYVKSEEVMAWHRWETDGVVENVWTLPNAAQDDVYMCVKRVINGSTKRFIEKVYGESLVEGGTANRALDCAIEITQASNTIVGGLTHLAGEQVEVWNTVTGEQVANGPYTVSGGGSITLPSAVTGVVVGLAYDWHWQSAKLAYGVTTGSPISLRKIITLVAPILYKTQLDALQIGRDADHLSELPTEINGENVDISTLVDELDADMFPIDGDWSPDSRIYMAGSSPKPFTCLGIAFGVEAHA